MDYIFDLYIIEYSIFKTKNLKLFLFKNNIINIIFIIKNNFKKKIYHFI